MQEQLCMRMEQRDSHGFDNESRELALSRLDMYNTCTYIE